MTKREFLTKIIAAGIDVELTEFAWHIAIYFVFLNDISELFFTPKLHTLRPITLHIYVEVKHISKAHIVVSDNREGIFRRELRALSFLLLFSRSKEKNTAKKGVKNECSQSKDRQNTQNKIQGELFADKH